MALIDEIIIRMINSCRAANQQEMLEICGFSIGLASKWKKRGKVPDGALAKVSEISGASIQYLKTGKGPVGSFPIKTPSGETVIAEAHDLGDEDTQGQIDPIILQVTIENTEKILIDRQITLTPAQKAQFICTLYEMAMEQGESVLEETNMKRLLRLVG